MNVLDHCADYAEELCNNHAKFSSFGWSDRPEDDHLWAIVYTCNRDSDLLEQSNAAIIEKELSIFDEDQCRSERHSHWACGWIDGYVLKVFTDETKTKYTPAFQKYVELAIALEEYPALDDEDFSQREYDQTIEGIIDNGSHLLCDDASEDWAGMVFTYFWNSDKQDLVCYGDYPDEEELKIAMKSLDLLESDDENDDM